MICECCGKKFKVSEKHYMLPAHGEFISIFGRLHHVYIADMVFCSLECAMESVKKEFQSDIKEE